MILTTYHLLELLGACEDADEIAVIGALIRLGAWNGTSTPSTYTTPNEIARTLGRSPLWVRRVCRSLCGKPHPLLEISVIAGRGDDDEQAYRLLEQPGNTDGPLPKGVRE